MSQTVGVALVRRYVGRRLGALRQQAGISQERAAELLQRGRITIIRLEAGDEALRFKDAETEAMLKLYGASPEDSKLLLGLTAETRNGRRKSWWHDYTETSLPAWFQLFVILEDSAEIIREYEPALVPGLLQTPAYAEAIMRLPEGYLTEEEVQRRVTVRVERQSLLIRPRAPHLRVVLDEAVLLRPVGGPAVMAEQLRRLAEVGRQPNVSVRIVPFAGGAHAGMAAACGWFQIFDFPDDPRSREPLEPPLVYLDSLTGALYLNKPGEVAAYRQVWGDLDERALGEEPSREMILTAMRGLEQ
jgi:transcriptional regulator with XRE-family HTH domain